MRCEHRRPACRPRRRSSNRRRGSRRSSRRLRRCRRRAGRCASGARKWSSAAAAEGAARAAAEFGRGRRALVLVGALVVGRQQRTHGRRALLRLAARRGGLRRRTRRRRSSRGRRTPNGAIGTSGWCGDRPRRKACCSRLGGCKWSRWQMLCYGDRSPRRGSLGCRQAHSLRDRHGGDSAATTGARRTRCCEWQWCGTSTEAAERRGSTATGSTKLRQDGRREEQRRNGAELQKLRLAERPRAPAGTSSKRSGCHTKRRPKCTRESRAPTAARATSATATATKSGASHRRVVNPPLTTKRETATTEALEWQ
mmetsp:Transcript_126278/g.404221  ORF Transcript_126278/g.404221 Transcript_126278/m.404221 type:complete len:311 (+) Transcript_126278:328-1260(+)